jgi:transposase-like protein
MTHPNAALTPRHRQKVARLVVDGGRPISEVAAQFQVSWPTVKRWVNRYRVSQSIKDRSSRLHHSANKTSGRPVVVASPFVGGAARDPWNWVSVWGLPSRRFLAFSPRFT